MIGQVHLPLSIVAYDSLVILTLLFRKGSFMTLLPDARRFRPTFEQSAGHHDFDQRIWRNLMGHKILLSFFKSIPPLSEQQQGRERHG